MTLADYLSRNGVSRRDFAAAIGVTEASLSRYISGMRIPRAKILVAIQQATGGAVTPNDFHVALSDEAA